MNKLVVLLSLVVAGCFVDEPVPDVADHEAALRDGDDDFPEELPPEAPKYFRLTGKSETHVSMRWTVPPNTTSTRVQRRIPGGTWTNVATFTVPSGPVTYTNGGLTQDSLYCYRVVAFNPFGQQATLESCALTEHPEHRAISRLQIELAVADVTGAGTDDRVSVSLNDTYWGNFTGLDYSHDDLERNSVFTYDLMFTGIDELHDISTIKIQKSGTDSLCLESVRLLLDGEVAFARTFGNTARFCRWLNGTTGFSNVFAVSHAELRAAPSFADWDGNPSFFIPHEELEDRIEGIVGNLIWNNPDVWWGELHGKAVEVRDDYGDGVLDIDLDLEADLPFIGTSEIDVDIAMVVRFDATDDGGWELVFETVWFNVEADLDILDKFILAFGAPLCGSLGADHCVGLIESAIENAVEAGFDGVTQALDVDTGECEVPSVTVNWEGAILFGCAEW